MPVAPTDRTRPAGPPLRGALLLAGALFTATLCAGLALVWLIDTSFEPGLWLVVVVALALGSMAVASYADSTPSSRLTRTTELGNATRLLGIVAMLLLVPSILLAFTQDDQVGGARAIGNACPEGDVPPPPFADVPTGATHAPGIACATWWGLFSAENENFNRGARVTRAHAAVVLDRLAGAAGEPLPEVDGGGFADVGDSVHAPSIARVAGAGIMGGTSEQTFSPDERIGRAQLATAIVRTYDQITGRGTPPAIHDPEPIEDVGGVHAENARAVDAAGILLATAGEFDPDDFVTRGHMATVSARVLDLLVTEGVTELPE